MTTVKGFHLCEDIFDRAKEEMVRLAFFVLFSLATAQQLDVLITRVFPDINFNQPVDLQTDGSSNIIYVVERRGVILGKYIQRDDSK